MSRKSLQHYRGKLTLELTADVFAKDDKSAVRLTASLTDAMTRTIRAAASGFAFDLEEKITVEALPFNSLFADAKDEDK